MPSALPLADPAPADGLLPASAAVEATDRAFGVYLHVPFCRVRCGYCDFNTYTADELRGVRRSDYAAHASAEVEFAVAALAGSGVPSRPASTVFFGGGTPTLLPVSDLARMLSAVRDGFGLVRGAEVTVEANPDSVDAVSLAALAAAGVTRVSFGMQSAVPHVLATLERTHDPARIPLVVRWAREAGLEVSLDLIYGTPGSPSLTGAAPSRPRSPRAPTTSRRTPSSWRTARSSRDRSAPGPCRCRTTTCRRTCTSSPTGSSARPATPGTR
ncbi:hypothetical protein GCM10025866_25420 [Naasia aerilata]|uniref:Heme chaperone HemW n=1 Tax=Naasia aerilata TaxID=1162966 RepID=A0ABM8GEA0_9MICO|nr:hypothetical protein GCM10025866_25420 [Naasia aerilata]